MKQEICFILCCLLPALIGAGNIENSPLKDCQPTESDAMGPFYKPDAPVRSKVGTGYVLSGQVLSAKGCTPLANSRIEFWLVNPQGRYDDAHRATVFADQEGRYRFESNHPENYGGRPPHIHMMVTAEGHERLVTQHYPKEHDSQATFNLVLVKNNKGH